MRRRTLLGNGLATSVSTWAGASLLDAAAGAPAITSLGGLVSLLGLAPDSAEAAGATQNTSTSGLPAGTMQRRPLVFPRDHGSHPEQAIEWWYLTGWLAPGEGDPAWGFQLTFFRSRGPAPAQHPSRFAASQVLMAHAALTELGGSRPDVGASSAGRLSHDQRIARAGMGLAEAFEADTAVLLNVAGRPWRLSREAGTAGSRYHASFDLALGREAGAARVALKLDLSASQPPLLQGESGWSRKGPEPDQASQYVSEPQLQVNGELLRGGLATTVRGRAWLDHEWSDQILPPQAQGWDWLGINLFDGSALTLFRLRRKPDAGSGVGPVGSEAALWAGGSWRGAAGPSRSFDPAEVGFESVRSWTSPVSAATYPVAWRLRTPMGNFKLRALADAQELDARASSGTVYWEGLAELLDPATGKRIGLGYLEMTGYAGRPAL
jgi:predicted secreted hydrolase